MVNQQPDPTVEDFRAFTFEVSSEETREVTTGVVLKSDQAAVIIGGDDNGMTLQLVEGMPLPDDAEEGPSSRLLALAILERLANDRDFEQEMLDWFDRWEEAQSR